MEPSRSPIARVLCGGTRASSTLRQPTKTLCAVTVLAAAAAAGTGSASQPESRVLAPGARVEKLADGFAFTEGPACDRDGNVLFTDQPNDRILRWSAEGVLSTWRQPSGRANGLCFDREGGLWACANEKNELWRISPKGEVEVVVRAYAGRLLNGPNDVWVHPSGSVYFTDPYYRRPYWSRGGPEQESQGVFRLARDRKTLARVESSLKQANGIIGTPDGRTLYVADIGDGKTYAYSIARDGSLADRRLFCSQGSDGMTIDDQGNVYLTGRGVTVYSRGGERIEQIDVPEPWTANVCFGGRDRRTLFITASRALYAVRTRVRGVGSQ